MTNRIAEPTVATCDTRKIYLKDASFEAPSTPAIFIRTDITPIVDIQIGVTYASLDKDMEMYDVVLKVIVTAKHDDTTLYLAEVHQAGVFQIQYPDTDKCKMTIEVTCPHILLPFAREELNNLITKGGFNPFLLAPINFMALFQNKIEEEVKQTANVEVTNEPH